MNQPATLDDLTQRNVSRIAKMQEAAHCSRTCGERVADSLAAWVGSWTFLITQSIVLVLVLWMTLNVVAIWAPWDPFPFTLLNLVLSFQAAFATPVILMSQNRQALLSERRNHLDLQVNLLAEQENTEQLRLLRLLCEKCGVASDNAVERAYEQPTQPDEIVREIQEQVEAPHGGQSP